MILERWFTVQGALSAQQRLAIYHRAYRGRLRELQQQKAKASSVPEGKEFGAQIESKIELAAGDTIESIKLL